MMEAKTAKMATMKMPRCVPKPSNASQARGLARSTSVFQPACGAMDERTVQMAQMKLPAHPKITKVTLHQRATKGSFDAEMENAFPKNGSATNGTTVRTTKMSRDLNAWLPPLLLCCLKHVSLFEISGYNPLQNNF